MNNLTTNENLAMILLYLNDTKIEELPEHICEQCLILKDMINNHLLKEEKNNIIYANI